MAVRWLRAVIAMPMCPEPGHVHRAGMGQRLPGASEAGSGQEKRESQGAAPAENSQHGAKLSCRFLPRKPDPIGYRLSVALTGSSDLGHHLR
jgi:hypothetical protein